MNERAEKVIGFVITRYQRVTPKVDGTWLNPKRKYDLCAVKESPAGDILVWQATFTGRQMAAYLRMKADYPKEQDSMTNDEYIAKLNNNLRYMQDYQ